MTATLIDIKGWIEKAQTEEATHLIVAVDLYNFDNYPVYVLPNENIEEEMNRITNQSLQGIDEVYNMSMNIDEQLNEGRAFHPD